MTTPDLQSAMHPSLVVNLLDDAESLLELVEGSEIDNPCSSPETYAAIFRLREACRLTRKAE